MGDINISDISKNASLSILAIGKKKTIEIPIKLGELSDEERREINAKVVEEYIALEVVKTDFENRKVVVSFQNVKAEMSLVAADRGEIYKWDNIKVDMIELSNGKKVHIIRFEDSDGVKFNRRKGVRMMVDRRMYVKQGGGLYPIILNDVSYCGFGFTEKFDQNLDVERPLILELQNRNGDFYDYIHGSIVRTIEKESGEVFHGCKVAKDDQQSMQKYVAILQMELIRGKTPKDVVKNEEHQEWKESITYQLGRAMKGEEMPHLPK